MDNLSTGTFIAVSIILTEMKSEESSTNLTYKARCALCNQLGELRKSHIIPEFMFKPMYDEKHRFIVLSTDKKEPNKFNQKGLRERLLCPDCETRLSKWETYTRDLFYGGGVPVTPIDTPSGRFLLMEGIDGTKFRLFQLSILWRASVSKLSFYKNVDLGPFEKQIGDQLLASDPGDFDFVPCLLFALIADGKPMDNFIHIPEKVRWSEMIGYRFVFGSQIWYYVVSKRKLPPYVREFYLSPEGSCRILIKDAADVSFVREFAIDLKEMGKLPD